MKAVVTALLLAMIAAPQSPARAREVTEHWYLVTLQDQPAGYSVMRETVADGRITNDMKMVINIARGTMSMTIEASSRNVETVDGKPISATSIEKLGGATKRTDFAFGDDQTTVTITQGRHKATRTLPGHDGKWLPPAAATRHVLARIAAGDRQVTYTTFDPSLSHKPVGVTVKVDGPTTIEAGGKMVAATKTRVSTSAVPGVESQDYIDADGAVLRTTVSLGFLSLTMEQADRELVKAQRPAPELMAATLITIDKPIDKPRRLKRARYRVSTIKGELPDLLETPRQSFERQSPTTGVITVDLRKGAAGKGAAPEVTHSSMIDGNDEAVVALTTEALAGAGDDKTARAETLRRAVYDLIEQKNLGVGFASAGDVARTKTGDCTEHAVLLAAMLRADGIPSRTASGLMYVPIFGDSRQVFGFHMWTQAWIDGRWVDLDAVLPSDAPFDATHITLATSDMDDGEAINSLVALVPLIGNLNLEVLEP